MNIAKSLIRLVATKPRLSVSGRREVGAMTLKSVHDATLVAVEAATYAADARAAGDEWAAERLARIAAAAEGHATNPSRESILGMARTLDELGLTGEHGDGQP